jgi:hypothetical protein
MTGKTHVAEDGFSVFWWTEGNGSCDCNRAIHFEGVDDEMNAQQHIDKPGLEPHQSLCYGCKRFIAIDVGGALEGLSKQQILSEMNSEYPRHSGGCSNQNVLDPAGAYKGVRECGCRKDLFPT